MIDDFQDMMPPPFLRGSSHITLVLPMSQFTRQRCAQSIHPASVEATTGQLRIARVALLPSPQESGTLRLLDILWRREIDKIKEDKSNQ